MQTIKKGSTKNEKAYSSAQEDLRKDVERAFDVFISRWHILERPAQFWYRKNIANVLMACIIMENMIFEERNDNYESGIASLVYTDEERMVVDNREFALGGHATEGSNVALGLPYSWYRRLVGKKASIEYREAHRLLQLDLIENNWNNEGIK